MVTIALERRDCGTLEQEEIILGDVKKVWRQFIVNTNGLDEEAPKYRQERAKLTKSMLEAIPAECMGSISKESVPNDRWKRPKLDIAIDDLVFELLRDYPSHPYLNDWKYDKEYWSEFVSSKKSQEKSS